MDAHQEFDLVEETTHKETQARGSIARKLYAGFGTLIGIIALIGLLVFFQLQKIEADVEDITHHAAPFEMLTLEIEVNVGEQKAALAQYLTNPSEELRKIFERTKHDIETAEEELFALAKNAEEKRMLKEVKETVDKLEHMGEEAMAQEDLQEKHYHNIQEDAEKIDQILTAAEDLTGGLS